MTPSRDASGIRYLLQTGAQAGLAAAPLLEGTGLTASDLDDADCRVQVWQELVVAQQLWDRCGAPGLGLRVGRQYHLTSLGLLGFTMLSSRTLGEAIGGAARFDRLSPALCPLRQQRTAEGLWIEMDTGVLPPALRQLIAERGIAAMLTVLSELRRQPLVPLMVELSQPPPEDPAAFARQWPLPLNWRYGAGRDAMLIAEADLRAPLPQAHPAAHRDGERLCHQLCASLDLQAGAATAMRLQRLLTRQADRPLPGAAQAARALGLSERQLHRRLAAEGEAYQAVVDRLRRHLAEQLLSTSRLTVEDIARRLGYAEAASFSRAFRRWTGLPPRQWRDRHRL